MTCLQHFIANLLPSSSRPVEIPNSEPHIGRRKLVEDLTMEENDLQVFKEQARERDRLLSPYGELVLLLDGPNGAIKEAMLDADAPQLLKIIDLYEDQLNNLDREDQNNIELIQKYTLLREFGIMEFRGRVTGEKTPIELEYDPAEDEKLVGEHLLGDSSVEDVVFDNTETLKGEND